MEQVPPGTQEFPTAAWMQHHFNQTMDLTHHRHAIAQSLLIPGVGVLANTPAPEMFVTETPEIPADINVEVRLLWFYQIKELVNNRESITEIIRQCISWIREGL